MNAISTTDTGMANSDITSTRSLLRFFFIILSSLVLLTWLFMQTAFFTSQQHINYVRLLDKQQEIEAKLDGEILASKIDLTENYDALNKFLQQTHLISNRIKEIPAYLLINDQKQLMDTSENLYLMIVNKSDSIDLFKRHNAILYNSLAYFQQASNDFLNDAAQNSKNTELFNLIESYVRQVLFFIHDPEEPLKLKIKAIEQQLQSPEFNSVYNKQVENLSLHAGIIIKLIPQLNHKLRQILTLPTTGLHQQHKQLYLESYQRTQQQAHNYRVALYLLGLLLTAYLVVTFFRLIHSQKSLKTAYKEITKRYHEQLRVEKLLTFHDAVFQSANEGMTITDAKGTILDVNPSFSRITGYSREEAIGNNPRVLKSGRHNLDFYKTMWKSIIESGHWRGEIWNCNRQGDIYPEILSITAIYETDNQISNYVAVFTDISEIKNYEDQLQQMAFYDALTGLPNRILLTDRLHQLMAMTKRTEQLLAVCFIDLDGFKEVNDSFGHESGDLLLIEMSHRLKKESRSEDTIARIGGDEFILLLSGATQIVTYEKTIVRILKTIAEPVQIKNNTASVSGSIGITFYPHDNNDADTLLRHADQAMYQGKQQGKNCYHLFDPKTDTQIRQKNASIARIERALLDHEMVLYYQPKVDTKKGLVCGMEALIRWQHPEKGLILPNEFLPIIEDDDLIIAIGEWVIESALKQLHCWLTQGLELSVSINVASRHLQDADFLNHLVQSLSVYPDIKPSQFEIEILETAALNDIEQISNIIFKGQEIGISFALDDFGTGYSSLTYLKRLPAQTLKIDQTFVKDMLVDPDELTIVHGVLGLASAFERKVVAEGVESNEHGELLIQLGCFILQGYGIAKPMPAKDISNWISNWEPAPNWQKMSHLFWDDSDYPILSAAVEHRYWIKLISHAVKNNLAFPVKNIMDHHNCHFGNWYYGIGKIRYAGNTIFKQIADPHRRVHKICHQIEILSQTNKNQQAKDLLSEMLKEQENVIKLIKKLALSVVSKDKN